MSQYDYYIIKTRNGDIKNFHELSNEELLDALDYCEEGYVDTFTTHLTIKYAAERGLVNIIDEKDL